LKHSEIVMRVWYTALLVAAAPCALAAQGTPAKDSTPPSVLDAVPLPTSAPEAAHVFDAAPKAGVDTVDRIVAVVGNTAITWNDLKAEVYQQAGSGNVRVPRDEAGQLKLGRDVLQGMIDEELLIQKAKELKVEVGDDEVSRAAEPRLREIRSHFASDAEYRDELKKAGMGTPEEFRRYNLDNARRYLTQQKVMYELRKTAKPGSVTDVEVDSIFNLVKGDLAKRPPMLTFRQIVIAPKASKAADERARAKADSLLAELKKGADFAQMAKRESNDPGSAKMGGDLGWARRGSNFVPEFEDAMFRLAPGQMSPPVKTAFGYHIIKVDRVQPGEVKVRHILIATQIDSADIARAGQLADSVAQAWRNGAKYDSLVAKFHDQAEEKAVLSPYRVDSLPQSYQTALADVQPNQISNPFELSQNGSYKFAIVQVVSRTAAGEYSLPEVRASLRQQLADERQIRAIIDKLRRQTYVAVRF